MHNGGRCLRGVSSGSCCPAGSPASSRGNGAGRTTGAEGKCHRPACPAEKGNKDLTDFSVPVL